VPVSRRTAEQLARQVADLFAETQSGVMGLPQQSAPAPVRAGGVTQGDESLSADDCTPSTTFIYALLDSRTGRVRYVGKSDDPDRRMREHCRGDRVNSHKDRWLAQLKREGLWPVLQVLEEVPYDEWQERECSWIAFYRDAGEPLTNMTLGGDGFYGLSADARARKHAAIKKAWADPEVRAKITAAHKRNWLDPDYRARVMANSKVVCDTPEHRAKLSAIQLAAWDEGLGMQWSSNNMTRHPRAAALLGINPAEEEIIAFLYFGYPAETPPAQPRKALDDVTRRLP